MPDEHYIFYTKVRQGMKGCCRTLSRWLCLCRLIQLIVSIDAW